MATEQKWVRVRRTGNTESEGTLVTEKAFERLWSKRGFEIVPEPTDGENLADLTNDELRDRLRAQGKSTTGTKDELIARLNEPTTTTDDGSEEV